MEQKRLKSAVRIRVLLLLVVGFLFRIWVARLVPQPFVYDQDQYYGFTLGMLENGLHADSYRLYGYPLLIAPIIYFFGVGSPFPWTIMNALLDIGTAILVYWLGRRVFETETTARIALILYLANPFTASYTGVLLTEITATFLATLVVVLFFIGYERRRVMYFLLLAFLLGYIPHVRPSFLFFTVAVLAAALWTLFRFQQSRLRALSVSCVAVFLYTVPFIYTVIANNTYFHQFAPLTVEDSFVRELYISLYVERGSLNSLFATWPQEVIVAWGAFSAPKNPLERREVSNRYFSIVVENIRRDPVGYISMRIRKMGYVWEKHYLFPYTAEPSSSLGQALVYGGNILFLLFGMIGFVRWFFTRKHQSPPYRLFGLLVLFFIVYITVIHSVSTSEERFSLPAYPIVALFAGYGIWLVPQSMRMKRIGSSLSAL